MSLGLIILIVLVVLLLGGFRDWGNGPFYGAGPFGGGLIGTILVIVLILFFLGRF